MVQAPDATTQRLRETIVSATIALLWIGPQLITLYAIVFFLTRVWVD
jgi:hypothetical protein